MTIKGSELLAQTPRPSEAQIRAHMDGHLCRCGILSAHHEGDPACIHHDGGSNAMNAILTDTLRPLSRRDLLKGGGALVVGFCIGGSALPAAAARGDAAGPPDPNTIDSWIAVHADNTATVYLGKGEFGQGNTTGLLQIAGEELDLDMSQLQIGPARHQHRAQPGRDDLELVDPSRRSADARGGRGGAPGAAGAGLDAARRADRQPRRVQRAWCRSTAIPAARSATARCSATSRSTSSSPASRRRSRSTGTSSSARACRASISRTR